MRLDWPLVDPERRVCPNELLKFVREFGIECTDVDFPSTVALRAGVGALDADVRERFAVPPTWSGDRQPRPQLADPSGAPRGALLYSTMLKT